MKVFLILMALVFLRMGYATDTCESCHPAIQTNCGQTCVACHKDARATFKPTRGHPAIIANPSDEIWWDAKCLSCHQTELDHFKNSLHYSSAGIISQTRFLWGKDSLLFQSAHSEAWEALKGEGKAAPNSLSDLADNLLAKKCLTCHFAADNRHGATGMKRASGCAACHTSFNQQNGKVRFGHRFQKKPPDANCLTCHTPNRVGADYYGYFEHDYHEEYNTPVLSRPQFGAYQHHLAQDVHRKTGMTCVDCHSKNSTMGGKQFTKFEGQQTGVQCESCHGGFASKASRPGQGRTFKTDTPAHQSFHQNVACSACHAQWSYQDYGLNLFLDESNHYEMWEPYVWQGDQQVTDLLQTQGERPARQRKPAISANRLSGDTSIGIWYQAWDFRRWETPVLGKGTDGKYHVLRPLYQYRVTYVDAEDGVWFDSALPKKTDGSLGWNWDAYVPHTIGARARACESCHGNPKAVGLGIRQNAQDSVAHAITLPNPPVLPGSRLLNQKEQRKLLIKSKRYKKWRAKDLQAKGFEQMLIKAIKKNNE